MQIIIDVEANSLANPTQIWLIVCKDIETNNYYIFRNLTTDENERKTFLDFTSNVNTYIGHNFLGYDYPVINKLLGLDVLDIASKCIDTLIISKLYDYSRKPGHSIESYGEEFGLSKHKFTDFSKYTRELEEYCIRDVDICFKIYLKYLKFIKDVNNLPSINLEHKFQLIVNSLHDKGFSFNISKAEKLLHKVVEELSKLDSEIEKAFPPRLKLIREIIPTYTQHGTLNKRDFRWVVDGDLTDFNGGPFCKCKWEDFNPSSHKQIIDVLTNAGWSPTDRTSTHIDTEREIRILKYTRNKDSSLDTKLNNAILKLEKLAKYGWKINENNLNTLPAKAPSPAKSLAKRILIEARRRTLTEWLGLVHPDTKRIHGKFYSIGAWTHRMAHQQPNTANIPTDVKLYGREMRSLWQAPRNRLLVGVDAEGIQLRVFAHYIDDSEFTQAIIKGSKRDGTDPHSFNQKILGDVCKTRAIAKRFIYALLLGAGLRKLSEILDCSIEQTEEALRHLLTRYEGFAHLKKTIIPADAQRGWFTGFDGRKVRIPGNTTSERRHLCMSGYLQNGEAVIMKKACCHWQDQLNNTPELMEFLIFLVNFVHDEWQTELENNIELALKVAQIQAISLQWAGEDLKLKCPMAGTYWNEEREDYTIGANWSVTH